MISVYSSNYYVKGKWLMNLSLLRAHVFWISVSIVVLLLAAMGDSARELFRYQSDLFSTGEYWRIITSHFVHLSLNHTLFNVAGTAIFSFLFARQLSCMGWWLVLAFLVPISSMLIYTFNPDLGWYVGFSGVLHGLLITGGILELRKADGNDMRMAIFILIVVVAKLIQEQFLGGVESTTEEIIGGKVFPDAHLYGALAGVVSGVFCYWWKGRAKENFN